MCVKFPGSHSTLHDHYNFECAQELMPTPEHGFPPLSPLWHADARYPRIPHHAIADKDKGLPLVDDGGGVDAAGEQAPLLLPQPLHAPMTPGGKGAGTNPGGYPALPPQEIMVEIKKGTLITQSELLKQHAAQNVCAFHLDLH